MGLLRPTIFAFACALAVTAAELHPVSDAFIDHINSKQTTWTAGRNFPPNTPIKHLKKLLGVHPDYSVNSLPRIKHDAEIIARLPESFDPRDKWPNCPSLNEIRDQGSCGCCWAISAVEAMTDRVCIYSNGTRHFHFSAEDLVSCCFYCGNGCHGGDPMLAWLYWQEEGLVSGGNYNSSQGCKPFSFPTCETHEPGYTGNSTGDKKPCLDYEYVETPKCLKVCDDNYGVAYEDDKRYGQEVYFVIGEEQIKAELFQNGPVEAVFDVYADFFNYKSGVYKYVEGDPVYGHAIKIIGWGVEDGVKYWLVANSWNTDWGDKGFFKILRGENHLGIESNIVAGTPLLTDLKMI